MTTLKLKAVLALGLMILGVGVVSAYADSVTFNFNSLATGSNNAAVQTYMNGLLSAGQHVTVTGSKSADSYNGDGYVVGPCAANCVSKTLDSAGGNFIINAGSTSDTIGMTFTGIQYNTIKFDLEIFPDGTCNTDVSKTCTYGSANWPDFEFYENGNLINKWLAQTPGTSGGSSYTHSPHSGSGGIETDPQLIVYNVSYTFQGPITSLSFKDWPATVGVDNITLSVPEPSSLLLLGVGVVGMLGMARKKFQA